MANGNDTANETVLNPIYPEYIPRLSTEFIELYNKHAADKLAGHQVPIAEVLRS